MCGPGKNAATHSCLCDLILCALWDHGDPLLPTLPAEHLLLFYPCGQTVTCWSQHSSSHSVLSQGLVNPLLSLTGNSLTTRRGGHIPDWE